MQAQHQPGTAGRAAGAMLGLLQPCLAVPFPLPMCWERCSQALLGLVLDAKSCP